MTERPRAALRRWGRALGRLRAELFLAAAICGGWLLVTWGVASLLVWEVWPISVGLLLLSAGGWRMLGTLAREGLYTLTRKGG